MTDATPANTTFVSASVTTGIGWTVAAPAVGGTGNVVFSKANVSNGEIAVFSVVVKVNSNTASGATITNTAVAATTTTDPNGANNTGTATTTVQTSADLAVTKSDSPDPVSAGGNLTYTINFSNSGPSDAANVAVTDAVPANTTFVSATVTTGTGWTTTSPAVGGTGNVVFSKGAVAASETAVFTIVVNVNAGTADGAVITNSDCAKGTTALANGQGLAEVLTGGCKIKLTHPNPNGPKVSGVTITATANICTGVGTATVVINGVTHTLTDPNVNDGTCSCPVQP